MSSATSTEERAMPMSKATHDVDPGLRPWQFFLLAGMLAATGVVLVAAGQSPASIVVLSLTVVTASFVALGAYRSLAPLVVPERAERAQLFVGHLRGALEREKTLVLRAIKDLEFDYAMKKVAQRDFDEMSARLRARALGLMRQLDSGGGGYKDQIERELAERLRALATQGEAGASAAPIVHREMVASEPTIPHQGGALSTEPIVCSCGTANDHDARFCKKCGASVAIA